MVPDCGEQGSAVFLGLGPPRLRPLLLFFLCW